MTFRSVLFWVHLAAGLICGLVIGIMCFTGTVLAFEKELVAWWERDARLVQAPAAATSRLSIAELEAGLRAAHPEARPASIVFQNDPQAAVAFTSGRTGGFYVNPYTGEVRQPQSAAMGEFMQTMVELHRYLGFHGEESRPRGKWINGASNLAFCVLAMTGLYLWMPRQWSWRAVRPVIWFRQNGSSKARDFNWHNAIGFWNAPVLIVLTLTAVPISFQWGGRLIYSLTGTPAPAVGTSGPGALAGPPVDVPAAAPGAQPLGLDALLAAAQQHVPDWKTITLRTGNPAVGGRGGQPGGRVGESRASRGSGGGEARVASSGDGASRADRRSSAPQATTFTIRHQASWPRTASTTLALNPYNGEVLRRTGYAELNAAQQVRAWTRFLHTGEAVGRAGQFIAGLACLGGVFLVYTGFALSWRRFFGRRTQVVAGAAAAQDIAEPVTDSARME